MIDLELARRYLVATLPADEPVEIADPDLLDAAVLVLVNGKAAP